jgi:hypothetical protein
MPDLLLPDAMPEDLPWLLRLLPRADLYLQDEVELALHPTLTRVWCPKGRRGQRLVEAPGNNCKDYGFGLVDWRDGWFDWQRAPGRRAAPFCAQLRRAVARSQARGRLALVLLDNLGIHNPQGLALVASPAGGTARPARAGLHAPVRPGGQSDRVVVARAPTRGDAYPHP